MLGVSYPKLSTDGLDEINITGNLIIGLVKSVLAKTKGTKDVDLIKWVYAIVDGWLVKLITAFPKELGGVDLTTYWSRFMFNEESLSSLFETFVYFLENFMNTGFYQCSVGAS